MVRALTQCIAAGVLALLGFWLPTILNAATVQARVTRFDTSGKRNNAPNRGAVLWLTPILTSVEQPDRIPHEVAGTRFRLVQKNKRFHPHVLVVPVGSQVEFPNRDPFFHNVFSLFDGKRFDLGLYEAGTTRMVNFDRPGICYIFCNIHSEMSTVVIVLATPYYGISNSEGKISIPSVPAGRYQLHVWNERSSPEVLNNLVREITISGDPCPLGLIRLPESGKLVQTHKNKYGRDYDPATANPIYNHK